MVEPFEQRPEGGLNVEEIDDEAASRIDRAIKIHLDAIGMAVQPTAAVHFADMRQHVRRLEMKRLGNLHGGVFMAKSYGIPMSL